MRHAQFCVHDVLHSACLLSSILPCIGLTSSLEATKTVPMQKQPVAVWWRWSRVLEAGSFRSTREAHEGQLCHFCMYCIVLKGSLEEDSRRRGWLTLEWTAYTSCHESQSIPNAWWVICLFRASGGPIGCPRAYWWQIPATLYDEASM